MQATQPITNACTYHLRVQAEMQRPRFEEGAGRSPSLGRQHQPERYTGQQQTWTPGAMTRPSPITKEAVVQSVGGLVAEAASIV